MNSTANVTLSATGGNVSNSIPIYTVPINTANIIVGAVGSGGSGGSGNYYTTSGWSNVNTHSSGTTMLSIMAENKGDAIIKTHKHKINLDEMADVVETLKERLLILTPNFEKMEKYPALKEAYDHYKLIEALCKEEDNK